MSENPLTNNQYSIATIKHPEVYEKLRPLKRFNEDQAHGDNPGSDQSKHDEILSRQSQFTSDRCDYEIDLGSGRITKSISSYQSKDKQQQISPILPADLIEPKTSIDHIKERKPRFSFRTITLLSIGTTIFILMIVFIVFIR